MSRSTVALVATFFLAGASIVAGIMAHREPPAGLICLKPIHDQGTLHQGDKVSHVFELTNNTSKRAQITDIVKTCSCTSVECSSRELEPGQGATLTIEWNVGASRGRSMVTAMLHYQLVGEKRKYPYQLMLRLVGDVIPDLQYEPTNPQFSKEQTKHVIQFRPGRLQEVRLGKVSTMHQAFQARLLPSGTEVEITYNPKSSDLIMQSSYITVETNSIHEPMCLIPISVYFESPEENPVHTSDENKPKQE